MGVASAGSTAPGFVPTPSSRRESSWYFGDGALLFNQVASALAAGGVAQFPGRISTLDPVLATSLGEWQRGGSIGARVSRTLTPRLGLELSVDYSLARLEMTPVNMDSIEGTRASFLPAFNGLITFSPTRVLTSLTSTARLETADAHQLFTSGALIINLRTSGSLIPYAAVGASMISTIGSRPTASLEGNYQFFLTNGGPVNETDSVTVRDDRDDRTVAGLVGGGVKYHVSSRWGIQFDARVSFSSNAASTVLDATPTVAPGLPAGRGVLNAEPTIQFSNTSSSLTSQGVTAVAASTLTGPAMAGVRTFSGSGVTSHTNITGGIFIDSDVGLHNVHLRGKP